MYQSLRLVRRIVDERQKPGSVTPAATFVSSGADRHISESRTSATGALKSGHSEECLLRVRHFEMVRRDAGAPSRPHERFSEQPSF